MSGTVLVFAGSNRADSVNRRLAEAAGRELNAIGLHAQFVDLRQFPMPLYDGDDESESGTPPAVTEFQKLVKSKDALVIASPEYNGSFTALVKNTLDWISRPTEGDPALAVFEGKKAAVLSASTGRGGGQRGLKHLRELLEMIGVEVVPTEVSVARAQEAFDDAGNLLRDSDRAALRQLAIALRSALLDSRSTSSSPKTVKL